VCECFRILSLKTKDTSASSWLFEYVILYYGRHLIFMPYAQVSKNALKENMIFWIIRQRVMVISSRRFGTTYRVPSVYRLKQRPHNAD